MRKSLFEFKIDATQLDAAVSQLGQIDEDRFSAGIVGVLNDTMNRTYELSRKTMLAGINLTDNYVQRKMETRPATPSRPVAEIVAPVGKDFNTPLSHYGALAMPKAVRWKQPTGKTGPWPLFTPRTGDPARGIAAGEKPGGVSVEVARGARKPMGGVFTLPGKKDREGNLLLFRGLGVPGRSMSPTKNSQYPQRKTPRQRVEVLHGPSVYQLFRVAGARIEDDVRQDLEESVVKYAMGEFERALK